MKDLFESTLANVVYKEATANRLCCRLSEELKNRIKDEQFERYFMTIWKKFSFKFNYIEQIQIGLQCGNGTEEYAEIANVW